MKVLLTHRYFWPDSPPYGVMLHSLSKVIANNGHDVHVYASRPSYRESSSENAPAKELDEGVTIWRGSVLGTEISNFIVRAINVVMYCSGLFYAIIRLRPDVVTAATFPPIAAGWFASIAAKIVGARFIYHMQDIHPEVSLYSNGLLGRGVVCRLLMGIDNQTLRRAASVVVLSTDMANTLRDRKVELTDIRVINNPPVTAMLSDDIPPKEFRKDPRKTRVIFAGNLGRFQNLSLLAEGVAECFAEFPLLELVFLGEGSVAGELKKIWADSPQVKFLPFVPFEQAKILLEESDVGLVSLQSDIYRVSFPSKMTTYLSLSLPMLVLVEKNSELARITEEHGLGKVPSQMNKDSIAAALKELLSPDFRRTSNADWFQSNCSTEANQKLWLKLLNHHDNG